MKGNTKVIDAFNMLLTGELTAMDQYLVHAEMYEDMGLDKLHQRIEHEFEDEKGHAKALIDRILFLEGKPDVSKRDGLNIGANVKEMLTNDLNLEYAVVKNLREVIQLCEEHHDYQSRKVLLPLLEETEQDHVYWLEQQLGLIDKVGLQNYLQSMM